ncbi:MAG: MaoC family dehydratase N-terminal domain-containing protein [Dehalococcoidales bacterium]|nr:MaoC family dehydratase N-terminal domain-containing protein [Dehalococcoidales bacterium]
MYRPDDLLIGMPLKELKKLIKQDSINMYAEVSGDKNPIHLDPEFGKKMQLGGTIAHGMIILAYVSEFMLNNFGPDWLTTGEMNIRFKEPARPGDNIIISGKLTNIDKDADQAKITCDMVCQNQKEQVIITGETKVRLRTL